MRRAKDEVQVVIRATGGIMTVRIGKLGYYLASEALVSRATHTEYTEALNVFRVYMQCQRCRIFHQYPSPLQIISKRRIQELSYR